ncbi:MAG TPA: hypothetical protein VGS22_20115 [Thermoanaerobaculia bacterium]|jgi:hypothetical protein|nr:hypothetical protein [Thermoanaerobaculia bacterium]
MKRSAVLLLGLLSLLLPGATQAASPPRAICDASAALTVIGVDTAAGQTLLSLRSKGGDPPGWVIELDATGDRARAFSDPANGRFGGSVGPGPVLAAVPCSGSCLQPVRWSDGAFRPLGEPLTAPEGATTAATYDAAGTPWFVLLAGLASDAPLKNAVTGDLRAWGWRFDGEWRDRGSQTVSAVGDLPASPAPGPTDGIVVGTGRYRAGSRPELWAVGLPTLPPERRGQLLALSEHDAAYLSADGAVYGSTDAGASWKRSTWTPWSQGAAGPWHAGTDYWVDLPLGERRGALQLAWFDRRVPNNEQLILTRRDPDGSWVSLVEAPSAIRTKGGDFLTVSHVLLPREGHWLLLSGCVATKEGSGLVLRTFDGRKLSEPRYVAIEVM